MSPLWGVRMSMSAQMETSPITVDQTPSVPTQLALSVVPVSQVISSLNERKMFEAPSLILRLHKLGGQQRVPGH